MFLSSTPQRTKSWNNYYILILFWILFLGINIYLILNRQKGFLILDQRGLFFEYAQHPLSTKFGNTIEYPIGAFLVFKSILLIAQSIKNIFPSLLQAYYFSFSLLMLITSLSALTIIINYLKENKIKKQIYYIMIFLILFFVSNPYLQLSTFDALPSLLFLLTIVLVIRKREVLSAILLGLATLIKWFPAIGLPLILFYVYKNNKDKSRCLIYFIIFLLTITIITIFGSFFIPPAMQINTYLYHFQRGLNLPSIYGNILYIVKYFSIDSSLNIQYLFHSLQINGFTASQMIYFVTPIWLISIALITLKGLLELNKKISSIILIKYSLLSVLVFILFNKVLSAQFLFWIWPLLFLYLDKIKTTTKNQILIFYLLSLTLSPFLFLMQNDLIAFKLKPLLILSFRNLFLIILLYKIITNNDSINKKTLSKTTKYIYQ